MFLRFPRPPLRLQEPDWLSARCLMVRVTIPCFAFAAVALAAGRRKLRWSWWSGRVSTISNYPHWTVEPLESDEGRIMNGGARIGTLGACLLAGKTTTNSCGCERKPWEHLARQMERLQSNVLIYSSIHLLPISTPLSTRVVLNTMPAVSGLMVVISDNTWLLGHCSANQMYPIFRVLWNG